MDVGDPSNFARILDLYKNNHSVICQEIDGFAYSDNAIKSAILECFAETKYLLDPHGACEYLALKETLKDDENGVFLETAHPIKFKDTVELVIGKRLEVPEKIQAFMKGKKQTVLMSKEFSDFKTYLMNL
jgi:threonine synthase